MAKNLLTAMEAFSPAGRIYEYYLQRLRFVASEKTRILRVHEIRDVPDSPAEFPCIEVVIRIPGLKIPERIRSVFARLGCQVGSLLFRIVLFQRATA